MATIADLNVVIGASIDDFEAKMGRVQSGLGGLSNFAKSAGESLSTFVTLPLSLLAGASIAALAKIDGLTRGLNAVSTIDLGKQGVTGLDAVAGAAAATSERLKLLQEIARAPGIGFEQAVQGDIRLRAVGIAAGESAAVLKEFANAIALTGGGASKLDEVTVQLAQLSAKGKVLAQDLRPVIEAAPAVATALQKLYGTVDSETISKSLEKQGKSSKDFIAILTDELGKLPRVTGGIGNSLDNFAQGATQSLAKLGDALNKAFNVDANVNRLADFITGLTDSFAALDPTAQKAIFVLAGLAAAAGPVLVAIGTLGVALPAIALGFPAITGPIALAIAAVLALTAAGVAYAASGTDTTEAFRSQAASVKALTDSVNPLLTRYDELKAKSVLTKAEQEELRGVIEKVGKQIPTSITAFDAYGKALDINSDKAREFVKTQQEILAVKNREALTEQRDAYARLTEQINGAQNALKQFDAQGSLVKTVFDEAGGGFQKLTDAEIAATQARLEGLRAQRRGVGGLIDELKGIVPAIDNINEKTPLKPIVSALTTKEIEKALKALQDLDKGFENLGARTTEGLRPKDAPEFIATPKAELGALPTTLKLLDGPKGAEQVKKAAEPIYGALAEFNSRAGNILGTGLGQLAETFLSGLGQLATGTLTAEQFGGGLLGVIGQVCTQLGQAVIAVGIGMLGLKTAFTNPLGALAAGAALLVVGSALSSIANSAVNSGGGGGGSIASAPRSSFTPTTAPNIAAPGNTTRNIHNVVFELSGNKLVAAIDLETDRLGRVIGAGRR